MLLTAIRVRRATHATSSDATRMIGSRIAGLANLCGSGLYTDLHDACPDKSASYADFNEVTLLMKTHI